MTPAERRNPSRTVDPSRRRRIAAGAGVEPQEVNGLVKQFDAMADMMKKMASMGFLEKMKTMQQLQKGGLFNPGAKLQSKGDTGKRLTKQEHDSRRNYENASNAGKNGKSDKKNKPDNND